MMKWPELADRLLSAIYPQRCVICDDVVEYDDYWCGSCEFDRPASGWITEPSIKAAAGSMAAVNYEGPIRSIIWRLKNNADKRCLGFLANEMLRLLDELCGDIAMDVIVPVPTSESRLNARGFNQAELLAERIGDSTGIPMLSDVLCRSEDSLTQRDLTASERAENALRSYDLLRAESVKGKTVLLVDDVMTTGATLSVCSGKLVEAGAERVYALTATRTKSELPRDLRNQGEPENGGDI